MARRGRPSKSKIEKSQSTTETYLDKVGREVQSNQSKVSMILGALIILVVGILIFNYFNRNKADLGPAQTTQQQQEDVAPDKLPGKYTVKEGDTLFLIAEKYYGDGFKYSEIVKVNNLANENAIEVGQVLEIPKVEAAEAPSTTPFPTQTPSPTPEPSAEKMPEAAPQPDQKGAPMESSTAPFGPAITSNSYTVQEGDWLSKIAARAYKGDIWAYQKIAQANNIPNPDLIFPGQVLTIPR